MLRRVALALVLLALALGPAAAEHAWLVAPTYAGVSFGPTFLPRPATLQLSPPCAGPVRLAFAQVGAAGAVVADATLTLAPVAVAGEAPACLGEGIGAVGYEVADASGSILLVGYAAAAHPGAASYLRGTIRGFAVDLALVAG